MIPRIDMYRSIILNKIKHTISIKETRQEKKWGLGGVEDRGSLRENLKKREYAI